MGRAPYSAAKWGVEGFSEVLAKEMAPLGIRVSIMEPGGFRTDFAGSSTTINEGRPEYDSTVGAAARFQRNFNGNQPGDPAKAATVILQVAVLVSCPRNTRYFAGGQLAVFQGASEAPISESYGSSEQRGKTANWPRPGGLR
jgi:NAD(P)-dependent dehydrogenase (short-subunit alcohol dehydrogenase family)